MVEGKGQKSPDISIKALLHLYYQFNLPVKAL